MRYKDKVPELIKKRIRVSATAWFLGGGAVTLFLLSTLPQDIRWYPYAFLDIGAGLAIIALILGISSLIDLQSSLMTSLDRVANSLEDHTKILGENQKIAKRVEARQKRIQDD